MAKVREIHICSSCGHRALNWQGRCPGCGEWNTLEARTEVKAPAGKSAAPLRSAASTGSAGPEVLGQVQAENRTGHTTGSPDLDRVLGKGLVSGSAVLLGGEPGIGKSTLLLQLAGAVAAAGQRVIYVSGEESLPQLKLRGERLQVLNDNLFAQATGACDDAVAAFTNGEPPSLVIVDSVQTLASSKADGVPGSVGQVRAVSTELIDAVKQSGAALIIVGHVTKDGQIAGPKLMEHMVDTVLSLEGDRRHAFRILRVLKNRFGPSDELLVFQMQQSGLAIVSDPATFFLDERDSKLPGSALVMAVDGHRPFAVEVQALAASSTLSNPRRTALGYDGGRLNLLLAVIEKQLKLNLSQVDIYTKIGGGLKLNDPALDLGLAAAILSSFYDRPLPESAVFWGEIDLNGRIRPAASGDTRHKQAKRLGYGPIFSPQSGFRNLGDFQQALFKI